ncbi:hypothetical protein BJ085DRAFT_27796 [Dimargaris cristalligena]|uniref:Uncharacterized protein n=1 Tax=Dimargaris cristalligena TaxID=215637 RepID=A0A4P9ZMK1_9FUNG|nr:hypothetical protein BJ085DRAFT_27796 [Dimargaris cristalligena]|eukprot:RKP34614.1 hypothetical protein BJ085DRAFT_27796 [Dimargaris cristalligena]
MALDMRVQSHWDSTLMPKLKLGPKVLQALMDGGQLVNGAWFKELIDNPARLQRLVSEFDLSDGMDYIPDQPADLWLSLGLGTKGTMANPSDAGLPLSVNPNNLTATFSNSELWLPNPDRKTLLTNWGFACVCTAQHDSLQPVIEAGDGVLVNLSPDEYPTILQPGTAESPTTIAVNLATLKELMVDYDQEYPGRTWALIEPSATLTQLEAQLWEPDANRGAIRDLLLRMDWLFVIEPSITTAIILVDDLALGDSLEPTLAVIRSCCTSTQSPAADAAVWDPPIPTMTTTTSTSTPCRQATETPSLPSPPPVVSDSDGDGYEFVDKKELQLGTQALATTKAPTVILASTPEAQWGVPLS